jgi:hypothetical protein
MHRLVAASMMAGLIAMPAHAESIREQIVGEWSLAIGGEQFADGKRIAYWNTGRTIFTASGQFVLLLYKDRPKPEGPSDPRIPVGPMVANYGRYAVDEDAKTMTYYIDTSSAPALNGETRSQSIQMNGETYTTMSTPIKMPSGEVIIPVNEWRRAK